MKSDKRIVKIAVLLGIAFIAIGSMWLFLDSSSQAKAFSHDQTGPVTHLKTSAARPQSQGDIEIVAGEPIAGGFRRPVQAIHAGDGSGRLFIVEHEGIVSILKDGEVLDDPFLDISDVILNRFNGGANGEGLFSIAFPPDYANKGHFYVYYTYYDEEDEQSDIAIARYQVTNDPDVADPNSGQVILTIPHPDAVMHYGGNLAFSPVNGYLYVGAGDGQNSDNPQDGSSLLGKMLRLDVETNNPATYAIPKSNPYTQTAGIRDEIWSFGMRNPYRMSFDRETGDLYIGDVGRNDYEEIDYMAADAPGGLNFGWPCREGPVDYKPEKCGPEVTLTDPITSYIHPPESRRSVVGGFVYRGDLYPALQGYYFYADTYAGADSDAASVWAMRKEGDGSFTPAAPVLDSDSIILAFGEDEAGQLYLVEADGNIRPIADINGAAPDFSPSTKLASTPHADPGEEVTYTIVLRNKRGFSGETFSLTDVIPPGLNYVPDSLSASHGAVNDDQASMLTWEGSFAETAAATITYKVTVANDADGALTNEAVVTGPNLTPFLLEETIFTPRPVLQTTKNDFFLPGTQPTTSNDFAEIPNPIGCDFCHTAPIYGQWRGSMMSQAGRDPVFWAALEIANSDAPGVGDYCLRCHTPKGWLEGRSHPAEGDALEPLDISSGIACEVCHRMVDPVPSPSDEAAAIDAQIRQALTSTIPAGAGGSAMMIIDPEDNRRGPFSVTPPQHNAFRTDFLSQSTNYETESRLCGTCHSLDNPVLSWDDGRQQYWPTDDDTPAPSVARGDLFPIERTFDEWLNSDYVDGVYAPEFAGARPDGIVGSCQDCHMPRSTGEATSDGNAVFRDCQTTGCLPQHELVGGNTWVPQILQHIETPRFAVTPDEMVFLDNTILRAREMLQRAATMTATLQTDGNGKKAMVRVYNQTGHKLPTGYPEGRRLWINLKAYDGNDRLIYESGAYNENTAVLTKDDEIKVYETKHGVTEDLAAVLGESPGETFHFVLNNVIVKDNRIPPRGFTQAALTAPGLRPVGATYAPGQYWDDAAYDVPPETKRIVATLYYQTSSKEYIDFLRTNGGPRAKALGALWDDSKSPPEVMVVASFPDLEATYLPTIFK